MNFNFRPAKLSEALEISLVLKQVYLEAYGTEGVSKLFADFITEQFSVEKIAREMQSEKHDFWVATCNENPIGVLKVDYKKPCPISDLVAPEINKIYLMRRFYRKGIGKRLMATAEQALHEQGHEIIWLQVWTLNDRAIEFYKKTGWKVIGDVWFWIKNNKYPNKILTKKLTA